MSFRLLLFVFFLGVAGLRCQAPAAEAHDSRLIALVNQLDNDKFATRARAKQGLLDAAEDPESETGILTALQYGLQHRSFEVREACAEIRKEIRHKRRENQLDRLLNLNVNADDIALPNWHRFADLVGHDITSRRSFARLIQRYPGTLNQLDTATFEQDTDFHENLVKQFDPYRLDPEDSLGWSMALLLDVDPRFKAASMTSRMSMALSHGSMGPKTTTQRDASVMRRLIETWVLAHSRECSDRERLLIGIRHSGNSLVTQLCDDVFADPQAPPATQVTAMLCAAAIDHEEVERRCKSRLSDARTAHVWQLIASRKTKIRTQVRDVALAVLLQHHGIDPRKAGFAELQADPLLVFRDHSLGFPNEESRQQAFADAMRMLKVDTESQDY